MPQVNLFSKSFRFIGMVVVFGAAAFGQCTAPAPTINSPNVPTDVSIPSTCTGNPIAFFDDYSWKAFLALVWPAQMNGQTPVRGTPNTYQTNFPTSGPLVFETYKADWETFQPNGAAPAAWSSYAAVTPCGGTNGASQFSFDLASFTKFGNLGQTTFSTQLAGPLVAQNTTYTRYLAAYNQTEFNAILNKQWYLRANVPTSGTAIAFPLNSVDIKEAWALVTPAWTTQQLSRYYTTTAMVANPSTNQCSAQKVALVGLHIVQKTATRPEWLWSSFEQVDGVPSSGGAGTFNNGNGSPMPASNPIAFPPPAQAPAPFNVNRLIPISTSTQSTNAAYQAALKTAFPQVPWQFYQLVMTQWPIKPVPNPSSPPATISNTFPGSINCPPQTVPPPAGCSAFANTTLETFDQAKVGTCCMNCHNATSVDDFVWSLQMNSFPPPSGGTLTSRVRTGPLHDLQALLNSTTASNKAMNAAMSKKKAPTSKKK
jgi:hypothetical protein